MTDFVRITLTIMFQGEVTFHIPELRTSDSSITSGRKGVRVRPERSRSGSLVRDGGTKKAENVRNSSIFQAIPRSAANIFSMLRIPRGGFPREREKAASVLKKQKRALSTFPSPVPYLPNITSGRKGTRDRLEEFRIRKNEERTQISGFQEFSSSFGGTQERAEVRAGLRKE
jgi:hypothetical protein